ncbi:MAG TPA: glycine/sarcosine/betaine reductase component B subunit [Tissierellaceae bacterium]|nr:glycine/sarcosine/betaine reductase component B subunit [Tissierellaceae bacterium]
MHLELGHIFIKDVQFGQETIVKDSILYVNKDELINLIKEDEHLAKVDVEIARPGESVRITPVKDVIEPRVKVEGGGGIFPGILSKVETVGSGKTNVLKGCAVVTTGKIVGFQEGIIDMTGPGAEYTPFSKLNNIVLVCEPRDGLKQHDHESAVRLAGLKAAKYLGNVAKNLTPDKLEVYETLPLLEGVEKYKDLPKVAYVLMLQSQGLLHDTYVYGVDVKQIVPTLLYPTEIMDGAIISGNCVSACDKNTSYHHQNNPVIEDLYAQHGKEINFVGVIVTNENVYLADKERSSDWTAKLTEFLGLDGVVISQEGFGNPDTDLIMNCKKIERKGIKTVIITNEYAGRDGASQSLADADALADAVVTGGNSNEVIVLPKMDKVIGTLDYADIIAGGFDGSLSADGTITVELQAITGATNELGFNKMSAKML